MENIYGGNDIEQKIFIIELNLYQIFGIFISADFQFVKNFIVEILVVI